MDFLLDTNIVSDLRRRRQDKAQLFAWTDTVDQQYRYISAISILEIEFGISRAEHRGELHAPALRAWFDKLLEQFARAVLSVDTNITLAAAGLQRIRPPRQ